MHQLEFKEESIPRFTLYIHFCTHTADLWKESVSEEEKKLFKKKSEYHANSKHWFMTSFLQPLPYLLI